MTQEKMAEETFTLGRASGNSNPKGKKYGAARIVEGGAEGAAHMAICRPDGEKKLNLSGKFGVYVRKR